MLKLSRDLIISKACFKLRTSSTEVVPFDTSKFKKNKIEVPMAHRSEYFDYGDDKKWQDKEYNYRLNNLEDIYYAVKDGTVIGHIGLDGDGVIRAVYVDPEHRRTGISEKMHLDIFKANHRVLSDDADAMEPGEVSLWEKLLKKMPNNIKKLKDGSFVYQS